MGAVPERSRFAVADLFSGAGGRSAGFLAAGFELAFALDKDEDSCVTYDSRGA
jgi:site-specific DNA-cytosine methylase